jgi:hypothetical protein
MKKRKKNKKQKALQEKAMLQQQISTNNAILSTDSLFVAAQTVKEIFSHKEIDLAATVGELSKQTNVTLSGDKRTLKMMLVNQAQTLQALFFFAAQKISSCENVQQLQAFNELAISANNACRRTIVGLHQFDNPLQSVSIKNQNNTLNAQINNCCAHAACHSEDGCSEKKASNELLFLENRNHETLDKGITRRTSEKNKALDALETFHRPTNTRRKKNGQSK